MSRREWAGKRKLQPRPAGASDRQHRRRPRPVFDSRCQHAGKRPAPCASLYQGTLALAHNGNLINAKELRDDLAVNGSIFQTTIDSEVIAYHIARERVVCGSVEEAVGRAARKIKGAYSLVIMSPRKLIGMRDPFGFKPLCIGKRDSAYILSSESCALDTIGAEFIRDVEPGEIVTITADGIRSDRRYCSGRPGKAGQVHL